MKNPGLAAILSFFFPGVGQFYNGQFGKGLVLLGAYLVNLLLHFVGIGFIIRFVVAVFAAWDAYKNAEEINRRAKVL